MATDDPMGSDGKIHVVTIRTSKGVYNQPIVKLVTIG